MNKTDLIAEIAKETGLTKKDAGSAVNAFVDIVSEELKKGGKVQLVGFGTFEISERAAREGRNPQTGEAMEIHSSKTPKFILSMTRNKSAGQKLLRKATAFFHGRNKYET